jgi:hypothetical protein
MSFPGRFGERTVDYLEDKTDDTMSDLMDVFGRIGNLTGTSTADWVTQAANLYNSYMSGTKGEYKPYLYEFETAGFSPNTALMQSDIGRGLGEYSLLNRPGFMEQAKDPSTVKVDQFAISDPVRTSYRDPSNRDLYNYEDSATQALIYGRDPLRSAKLGAFLKGATEQFTGDLSSAVSEFSNYGV